MRQAFKKRTVRRWIIRWLMSRRGVHPFVWHLLAEDCMLHMRRNILVDAVCCSAWNFIYMSPSFKEAVLLARDNMRYWRAKPRVRRFR